MGIKDFNQKLVKKIVPDSLIIKPLTKDERLEEAKRILTDGEKVIDSIPGKKGLIEGTLVLTPKRVFFYHSMGKGRYGTDEYSLDRISSINYSLNKVLGELAIIEIHSSDDKLQVVSKKANAEAEAFVKAVKQRIEEYKKQSTPVQSNNLDVADQISKLAGLRDKGILTEEEFTTQKRKLLGL